MPAEADVRCLLGWGWFLRNRRFWHEQAVSAAAVVRYLLLWCRCVYLERKGSSCRRRCQAFPAQDVPRCGPRLLCGMCMPPLPVGRMRGWCGMVWCGVVSRVVWSVRHVKATSAAKALKQMTYHQKCTGAACHLKHLYSAPRTNRVGHFWRVTVHH